jgi:hypothetical protein
VHLHIWGYTETTLKLKLSKSPRWGSWGEFEAKLACVLGFARVDHALSALVARGSDRARVVVVRIGYAPKRSRERRDVRVPRADHAPLPP